MVYIFISMHLHVHTYFSGIIHQDPNMANQAVALRLKTLTPFQCTIFQWGLFHVRLEDRRASLRPHLWTTYGMPIAAALLFAVCFKSKLNQVPKQFARFLGVIACALDQY